MGRQHRRFMCIPRERLETIGFNEKTQQTTYRFYNKTFQRYIIVVTKNDLDEIKEMKYVATKEELTKKGEPLVLEDDANSITINKRGSKLEIQKITSSNPPLEEILRKKIYEQEQYIKKLEQTVSEFNKDLALKKRRKYSRGFKNKNGSKVRANLGIGSLSLISDHYKEGEPNTGLLTITHLSIPRNIAIETSLDLRKFSYITFYMPAEGEKKKEFSINDSENQIKEGTLRPKI